MHIHYYYNNVLNCALLSTKEMQWNLLEFNFGFSDVVKVQIST